MPALMRQPRARLPEATSHRCGLAMPAPCRAPLIWEPRIKEDDKMKSGCRWVYTLMDWDTGEVVAKGTSVELVE